jgi:hypothetical protein
MRSKKLLVTVGVETFLGTLYTFPDCIKETIVGVVKDTSPGSNLLLANVTLSTLTVPMRVVRRITVGSEEVWKSDRCPPGCPA